MTLGETLVAVALMFALQWVLTRMVYSAPLVSSLVKAEPRLLLVFQQGRNHDDTPCTGNRTARSGRLARP